MPKYGHWEARAGVLGMVEDHIKLKRKTSFMKRFTVILMLPDYSTDDYGETWCETVAIRVKREELVEE